MKGFELCFCIVIGLCAGAWIGNNYGQDAGKGYAADACRTAGAFHYKRTGFKCERVTK